ncbi:MAG: sigma-54 interaction domain-containing protein [Fidelibacterota bacterium]
MNFLIITPDKKSKGTNSFTIELRDYLQSVASSITMARDTIAGMSYVAVEKYDAIWVDWDLLKQGTYAKFARHLRKHFPQLPVIIVINDQVIDVEIAKYMSQVFSIINRNAAVEMAQDTIARIVMYKSLQTEMHDSLLPQLRPNGFGHFIGNSKPMLALYKELARVAATDFTVLILGESGSGKELVAKTIHETSARKNNPFVSLNCAAIPENLLESELFGYEKGAFTSANQAKPGKFELADTGTIFLDEIGDMSLPLQAKLLRVLEDQIIERVGGTKGKKVDFRLLTATNRNLEKMVADGEFRSDLHFRLNVIPINIASLSNRDEDVMLLSLYLLKKIIKQANANFENISWALIDNLKNSRIKGNVRELENVLTRAVFHSDGNTIHLIEPDEAVTEPDPASDGTSNENPAELLPLHAIEKQTIEKTMEVLNGNVSKVASTLGISRVTLYRKLKKYEIEFQEDVDHYAEV